MRRNTYLMIGANLTIIGIIIAIMSYALINEMFITLIGSTTALMGIVLVGIGAEKKKLQEDYLKWALSYYREVMSKLKEHLGLQSANTYFFPSSKCGGKPCQIKSLEKINGTPKEEQLIIPLEKTYALKTYLEKHEIIPEKASGVSSAENTLLALLTGQYGVINGIELVETTENIIATIYKPATKEYGEELMEEIIFLIGTITAEALDSSLKLTSITQEKNNIKLIFNKA